MSKEFHLIKLTGNWEIGYALDVHSKSSRCLGYDEFGKPVFDTERSKLGELLYLVKYKYDQSVIPEIVRIINSVSGFKTIDIIVPVPSSRINRPFQPVVEIAQALGTNIKIPVLSHGVEKIKKTPELKNITNIEERLAALQHAFTIRPTGLLSGKTVLLFDDLYRSGATLRSLTSVLYTEGQAKSVKVLTLTKTRSKS